MAAFAESARDLNEELGQLLGRDRIRGSGRLNDYAIGQFVPMAVVTPHEVDEVSAVLRWAHDSGISVYPSGGRTLIHLGNSPVSPGVVLDLTDLDQLVDFQPADLTVRVQAGMSIAKLDAALAQDGKYVPLAAPMPGRATVGGTLATGVSGPLRSTYGLPRDWLIGMTVVGSDGAVSKCGGQVVKNVTGYDLNRLYTGSLGTLAVITEATFKITPAPTAWAAIVGAFDSDQTAVAACRDLLSQPYAPHALHLLNPEAAHHLRGVRLPAGYGPVAIAVVAGRPASTRRRVEDIAMAWLDSASTLRIDGEDAVQMTDALGDMPVDPHNPPTVCIRVIARPSALDQLMAMGCHQIGGVKPGTVVDTGFGGGRLLWWNDVSDGDPGHIAGCLRDIQRAATALGGSAIIETCPQEAKDLIDVWGPEPSALEIMRRIKRQFDPQGVLNPGRFVGGL